MNLPARIESLPPVEVHQLYPSTDDWVPVVAAVGDLASKISGTQFVPKALRGKPAETAACILYGRELGLPPMRALNEIHVIEGSVSLSSTAMRALVFAGGHNIVVDEWTDQRCTVSGWRKGSTKPAAQVTYTLADAQRAGLHQRGPWKQHPRSMLLARATSELCRAVFPDVIGGLQLADDAVPAEQSTPSQIRRRPMPALPEQRNGQPEPRQADPTGQAASEDPHEAPHDPTGTPADPGQETAPLAVEDIPAPPTTRQLRMLHALLRGAGHTTDEAVHAVLSRALERPIESRRELTREEVGRLLDRPELLKGSPMPGCRCGESWGGLKICHCAECHETFSGLREFDRHRRGTYEPHTRHCITPEQAKLIRNDRRHWQRFDPRPHPHCRVEPASAFQPSGVPEYTPP